MKDKRGIFVFSLDTELGTGYFDKDERRKKIFSPDGSRERQSIKRLLALLEKYEIRGTWAIVGHIFYGECENCVICPIKDWKGKYNSYEEAYQTAHPLWYGADIVQHLLEQGKNQELGFHGYTHEIFVPERMSEEKAEIQITEWIRVAKRFGLKPGSIVFPRDRVGFLELFQKHGFICYRAEHKDHILVRNKYFGRFVKVFDYLLGISRIPTFKPLLKMVDGLVKLESSQHFFAFNRDLELALDKLGLQHWRNTRIMRGVDRISRHNEILHLWAHPWEFRTDKDFEKLEKILQRVHKYIQEGKIRSLGMLDLANELLEQKKAIVGEN